MLTTINGKIGVPPPPAISPQVRQVELGLVIIDPNRSLGKSKVVCTLFIYNQNIPAICYFWQACRFEAKLR